MHPTQKHSKSRTRIRRSHHALKGVTTVSCPNCGSPKLPHAACRTCGYVRPGLILKREDEEE